MNKTGNEVVVKLHYGSERRRAKLSALSIPALYGLVSALFGVAQDAVDVFYVEDFGSTKVCLRTEQDLEYVRSRNARRVLRLVVQAKAAEPAPQPQPEPAVKLGPSCRRGGESLPALDELFGPLLSPLLGAACEGLRGTASSAACSSTAPAAVKSKDCCAAALELVQEFARQVAPLAGQLVSSAMAAESLVAWLRGDLAAQLIARLSDLWNALLPKAKQLVLCVLDEFPLVSILLNFLNIHRGTLVRWFDAAAVCPSSPAASASSSSSCTPASSSATAACTKPATSSPQCGRVPLRQCGRARFVPPQRLVVPGSDWDVLPRHRAYCNHCSALILGTRFKCDTCFDYDLCGVCYDFRAHVHTAEHTFVELRKPTDPVPSEKEGAPQASRKAFVLPSHPAVCDSCNRTVRGVRYHCEKCPDFDLCGVCIRVKEQVHAADHSYTAIGGPSAAVSAPVESKSEVTIVDVAGPEATAETSPESAKPQEEVVVTCFKPQEEVKQEEVKQEEVKQEEVKQEEVKQEEVKKEEVKKEEVKKEEEPPFAYAAQLRTLLLMGFEDNEITRIALRRYRGNVSAAVDFLLEVPHN